MDLFIDAVTTGKMHVEAVGSDIKAVVKKARALAKDMEFISPRYNIERVHTYTKLEDAYILTTPDMEAELDVDLLAGVFNLNKSDFKQRIITIPNAEYFDNDRFSNLTVGERKQIRQVTKQMIELFKKVKFTYNEKCISTVTQITYPIYVSVPTSTISSAGLVVTRDTSTLLVS